MKFPIAYSNGNADITLDADGTRVISYEGALALEYPLNIDVRISKQCAYGRNPNGKAVCEFCHESATTDGKHASCDDIRDFFDLTDNLPYGTELAVGINQFTEEADYFLKSAYFSDFVVNATVNQGHIIRDRKAIAEQLEFGTITGLGISYRPFAKPIPAELLAYQNTVVHVIAGIDDINAVKQLADTGVKKILVLGEKDFGFHVGRVSLKSKSHYNWYRQIHELFKLFDVVSFDNLALEQLNVRRFIKDWDTVYQHEFSFYANLVDRTFSPSSRSVNVSPMADIKSYFAELQSVA